MPREPNEKDNVINQLMDQSDKNKKLERDLRIEGKYEEADRIWAADQVLSVEIDILLGHRMDDWKKSANEVKPKIEAATKKFEVAAADIKKGIDLAKNVIKVLGYIDDLIGIAKSLLI